MPSAIMPKFQYRAQGQMSHDSRFSLWISRNKFGNRPFATDWHGFPRIKKPKKFSVGLIRGNPCQSVAQVLLWHTSSMQRLTLGDFELTVFSDGVYPLDGGAFFGVVPKVMWSRKVEADAKNYVTAGLNSLLVRTGKQTVLIETGMGNKLSERMVKFYGQPAKLLDDLAAGGVAPDEIDIVINSHLHFDHCGWNTVRDSNGKIVPTFPRAKYYAPEGEWEYARRPSDRDSISFISENYDPLVASGQMTLLKGGEEIVPGISVEIFPGHTAHMLGVLVHSQGKTACYISDLIPTTAHIDITWGMSFDLYPLQTIESKKQYYSRSIPEKWLTVFTHDAKTPWAYVEKDELGKMVARGA
jgi:glyoxylase-like metal-dependent hydrolase (beta-lactamase superfamily II)